MISTEIKRCYSQRSEQDYILSAVGDHVGTFLEIGSYHPTVFSNTRALVEKGWAGVMIEPAPGPFLNLMRACVQCGDIPIEVFGERKALTCEKCGGGRYGNEPRLTLICAAVSCEHGLEMIHATDDAVSTANADNYAVWKERGGFYGKFYSPKITISDILNQFGSFDFVSVDAEGTSVDLFHALLATGMRPRCICVEFDNRLGECIEAGQAAGYRQEHKTGENLIFAL